MDESVLHHLPQYAVFRDLTQQNIGFYPELAFSSTGISGHRIRIYDDPPGADINLSVRGLARHHRLSELLHAARSQESNVVLIDGLCAEAGGDFLCSNKFNGLLLLSQALSRNNVARASALEIAQNLVRRARTGDHQALVDLLLPIGHEIGHLAPAQEICPDVIHGDQFLETYQINYERIRPFVGEFAYAESLNAERSPLHLKVLRTEVAADYFATCSLAWLLAKTNTGKPYPIIELSLGLMMFPLVLLMESMCSESRGHTRREIQERALAMQCRNSILADAIRGNLKTIFAKNPKRDEFYAVIDQGVDHVHAGLLEAYQFIWGAIVELAGRISSVAALTTQEVLTASLIATPHRRQRTALSTYINSLLSERGEYALTPENEESLRTLSKMIDAAPALADPQSEGWASRFKRWFAR